MKKVLVSLWNDDSGQALPEYGLLMGAGAATLIAAITQMADAIIHAVNVVAETIRTAGMA